MAVSLECLLDKQRQLTAPGFLGLLMSNRHQPPTGRGSGWQADTKNGLRDVLWALLHSTPGPTRTAGTRFRNAL